MKKLTGVLLGIIVCAACANAQDIEKIKELQALGFTNEQIIEMMNKNQQPATSIKEPATDQKLVDRMEALKKENKGLVVIVATKEDEMRGPGYINISVKNKNINTQLEPIPIMEYALEGQKGNARTVVTSSGYEDTYTYGSGNIKGNIEYTGSNRTKFDGKANWDTTSNTDFFNITRGITVVPDIVTSRYISEYPLSEGIFEITLSRNFVTKKAKLATYKNTRHKIFHDVEVEAGKVTILSYYWKENTNFGKDMVMSRNHKILESNLAEQFGPYLKYVKIQHNK